MIQFDTSELQFRLKVEKGPGFLSFGIECDNYVDDTLSAPHGVTLYGIDIIVEHDGYKISTLVDLHITSNDSVQEVMVNMLESELIREELVDIMEDSE